MNNPLRMFILEVIKKCQKGDGKTEKSVCLYAKKTGKLLGAHKNKKSAEKQEKVIEINKHL